VFFAATTNGDYQLKIMIMMPNDAARNLPKVAALYTDHFLKDFFGFTRRSFLDSLCLG